MHEIFDRMAVWTARNAGRPITFTVAFGLILVWAASGPFFRFSDTWQLVINLVPSIVTFLMMFLIQATQNRDTVAIQLKLDELIRATDGAKNQLIALEDSNEEQVREVKEGFDDIRAEEAAARALPKARQASAPP